MSDPQFVTLDERVYKYIRQFTIKSVEDALIELITNSVDAYKRGSIEQKRIDIVLPDTNHINVIDNAIGIGGEDMEKCFLQVGGYTNVDGSRGFFCRGAKDISAIANLTFSSIKDGKFSQCSLNTDAYGKITVMDQDVTQEQRDQYKIPGNGLHVDMHLLPNFADPNIDNLAQSLRDTAQLRDIMSDPTVHVQLKKELGDGVLFNERIQFQDQGGTLLLDLTYNVPQYESYQARFVVYKTDTPIDQPRKESEMRFGFLMKDSTSVYEVNTIDDRFRWNVYMPYLYGYLECEGLNQLLHEFDTTGATTTNPFPIIDPSRLTGLNKQHPFVVALLSIPNVRLDNILRELNKSLSKKAINIDEINEIIKELENLGVNLFEEEEIKLQYVPDYDSELAKAIEDDRQNYVQSEFNYLYGPDNTVEQLQLDQYLQNEILKIEPAERESNIYVADPNGELVQIPNRTQTDTVQDPVQILDTLTDEERELINKRPYIYRVNADGQLTKLYIFEKGRVESVTNPENEYVVIKNKTIQISYIYDINTPQRYIIDNSSGIHVKINLHNEMVKKYMASKEFDQYDPDASVSLKNIQTAKGLVFLRDLMTDVMADIIVMNDISNNKLILESSNIVNANKVIDHRNKTVSKLELKMDAIFSFYLGKVKEAKETALVSTIAVIGDTVNSLLGYQDDNLVTLRDQLLTTMTDIIE